MLGSATKSNGMSEPKLDMDFFAQPSLGASMDDDINDLILQLCTRAGMLMEDGTDIALTMRAKDPRLRRTNLKSLRQTIDKMGKLIDAAIAITS